MDHQPPINHLGILHGSTPSHLSASSHSITALDHRSPEKPPQQLAHNRLQANGQAGSTASAGHRGHPPARRRGHRKAFRRQATQGAGAQAVHKEKEHDKEKPKPMKVKCHHRKLYPYCTGKPMECPAECSQSCYADCSSCKPVCGERRRFVLVASRLMVMSLKY